MLGALLCLGVLSVAGCNTCDTPAGDVEDEPETACVGLFREIWKPASPPTDYDWPDTRMLWWYTRDREVHEEDILPGALPGPGESFIPVLEMDVRGFRYAEPEEVKGWAGIQCLLSETGEDLSKYEFVEIWLRQKQGEGGRIHIDVGDVSEDFYRPWRADSLHTEDRDGDGELSVTENTGLDGVPTGLPGDDPYDNYSYNETDPDSVRYAHINGTENDPRTVLDTEDMDKDGGLDTEEVHFRFSLDVSDTTYRVHSCGEWAIHRIPLSEAEVRGGCPQWSSVKYVRVFFTEVERSDRFQLAGFCFADSSWAEWLEPYLNPPEDL
jgi:hypothetical protein